MKWLLFIILFIASNVAAQTACPTISVPVSDPTGFATANANFVTTQQFLTGVCIAPAINVQALTFNGTILNVGSFVPVGAPSGSNLVSSGVAQPAIYQKKPYIDVRDCGAVGDGVTNDLVAINNCIANNKGHKILFPKTQAVGVCDYLITGTIIIPKANADTVLEGESGGQNDGVLICSQSDATALKVNTAGATVRGLSFRGGHEWNTGNLATYILNGTSDGIQICGVQTVLDNVFVDGYSRHGINADSALCIGGPTDYLSADDSQIINSFVTNNQQNGVNLHGLDANVITVIGGRYTNNQLFGIQSWSSFPDQIINAQLDANHNDVNNPATTVALTSCSTALGVTSCISAANTFINNDILIIAGSSNSAYNLKFLQAPVIVDSSTTFHMLTGNLGPADGSSTTGGTVGAQPGAHIWAAANVYGGCAYSYLSGTVWSNLYCEGNQPGPMIGRPSVVIGGGGTGSNIAYYFQQNASVFTNTDGVNFSALTPTILNSSQLTNSLQVQGWNTNTRRPNLHAVNIGNGKANNVDAAQSWQDVDNAGNTWGFLNLCRTAHGNVDGWWNVTPTDANCTSLAFGDLRLSDAKSTIGVGYSWFPNGFFVGTGEPTTTSSSAGYISGAGDPTGTDGHGNSGACGNGSIYQRTGGTGTSLYGCRNGGWVALN